MKISSSEHQSIERREQSKICLSLSRRSHKARRRTATAALPQSNILKCLALHLPTLFFVDCIKTLMPFETIRCSSNIRPARNLSEE